MAKVYTSFELEPWTPKLTPLPQNWEQLVITLLQETRGSPHPYVLEVRYDSQHVGSLPSFLGVTMASSSSWIFMGI